MKKLLLVIILLVFAVPAIAGPVVFNNTWAIQYSGEIWSYQVNMEPDLLAMEAGNHSFLTNPPVLRIEKTFELNAGTVVSGESNFYTEDIGWAFDHGWVEINNDIVWYKSVLSVNVPEGVYKGETGFEHWTWQVPETGLVTISFCQQGDDQLESWSYHRNVALPEPPTWLLTFLGIVFILFVRRRVHG